MIGDDLIHTDRRYHTSNNPKSAQIT